MTQTASKQRIVLAEDDPASRTLLCRQLEKAGYEVVACTNGDEALGALQRVGGGIVLADWMMPEMDGLTLARTVRRLQDENAMPFVYFVLLTAYSDKQQIVAGLEAGADDYLTKPYHLQELLARLRAGERICDLQTQLLNRQLELRRANAEMAALNRTLEQLANTDALTGLFNRRYLFERLNELWSQCARFERPLSLILFDIDRFKLINDTHGHTAGDVVLKSVAAVCRGAIRGYDLPARIGGEEFVIVCPETDIGGAVALAERLRSAIENHKFTVAAASIPVTVSLGVAERRAEHRDAEDLLAATDAMLYRAKETGRNRIWVQLVTGRMMPATDLAQPVA